MSDWLMWKPAPCGSRSGCRRPACARGATGPRRAARRAAARRQRRRATRYFHSMPASTSIMAVTPARTSAVPRSGCFTISRIKTTGMMAARSSVLRQSLHLVEARGQKPRQKQNEHGLGDLRGLEGEEAAEANPAMGVVRVGKEEDQHQQQRGDGQRGIDEARRVVAA